MEAQNSIAITSVMDGTTLNGYLYVQQSPLVQFFTKGSDNFIPNFKTDASKQPIVALVLRDTSTGEVYQSSQSGALSEINWKYNGITLQFGVDGLCTAPSGLAKRIKLLSQYSTNVDGKSVVVPAIRIVDNLVPYSDYDDDRLSVEGKVVIDNQAIPFAEVGTTVQIKQSGGSGLVLTIEGDNSISGTETTETLKAVLVRDGVLVTEPSALAEYTIKWSKVPSGTFKNAADGWSLVVDKSDVDGSLHIRCDVFDKSNTKTPLVTQFFDMHDMTDPWYILFDVIPGTGNPQGNRLRRGQDLTIKATAWERSKTPKSKPLSSCKWYTYDNTGARCTVSSATAPEFTAASVKLTYGDVKNIGKGGITVVCHATF